MKKNIIISLLLVFTTSFVFGQKEKTDTNKTVELKEIKIEANRLPISLKSNPGAISIVSQNILSDMPKTIAIDEALRLVPGVRIDNQHDGERVHMSIRGQGILTERGLRGIEVLIDGIPVNDPSGFAPDLYDVDWETVKSIEVLRGPATGLYGGGGSAGVVNITTKNGVSVPLGGEAMQTIGSNGFAKTFMQLSGTQNYLNYRVSYSRSGDKGYRQHQAFWSNKFYEKLNFQPSKKIKLTQIISHTDYFQQNPEGLSLEQLKNRTQANPDANPFNEYQKTNRTTLGMIGVYKINESQNIQAYSFLRTWKYKETSNKCAEYRNYSSPGASIQYNLKLGKNRVKNNFSFGADFKWQNIDVKKFQSAANLQRKESIDETNIETDSLLANELIFQQSTGVFALYRLELGKFNLFANARYDNMQNVLTNKLLRGDSTETSKDFTHNSYRLGISYALNKDISFFANWSTGFMPPSTEELANNPLGYSGFNTHLVSATMDSYEIGTRGFFGKKIYYEITGFFMNTQNDFFRFKQSGRGNQEVFYGNAGNSRRIGLETYFSIDILRKLNLQLAYTYSDFKYISAKIDPIYTDTNYVLTTPPASGQWLPNSPKHVLYSELNYSISKKLSLNLGVEYQSKWAIYTDQKAYDGDLNPAIYQNWQAGFYLLNASANYLWHIAGINGELSFYARNFTGTKYIAFTEPDPDGNSYQPGPVQEFFASVKIKF